MPVCFSRFSAAMNLPMKIIWTFLFLCIAGAIAGITALLVGPEHRTAKFWLSMGAICFALIVLFTTVAFAPAPKTEQSGPMMRGMSLVGSLIYFVTTFVFGLIAMFPISLTFLIVLHIIALLGLIVMLCAGALSATTLAKTDRGD